MIAACNSKDAMMRSCVACWHAANRDGTAGERRNIGYGGSALNLTEPATPPTRVVGNGFVELYPVSGVNVTITISRSFTTVQEVAARVTALTNSSNLAVAGPNGNMASGTLILSNTNYLRFDGYEDGSSTNRWNVTSSAAIPGYTVGTEISIKYVLTRDDGGGNKTVSFWYRYSDDDDWTQLGTTQTNAGTWGTGYTNISFTVDTGSFSISRNETMQVHWASLAESDGGSPVVYLNPSAHLGTDMQSSIPNDGTAGGSATVNRASSGPQTVVRDGSDRATDVFDGSNDYLYASDHAFWDVGSGNVSIGALHRQHASAFGHLIGRIRTTEAGYALSTSRGIYGDGVTQNLTPSIENAKDGTLTFEACIIDASNVTKSVNGSTQSTSRTAGSADTNTGMYIGATIPSLANFFTGEQTAQFVARRALTAAELRRLKAEMMNYLNCTTS